MSKKYFDNWRRFIKIKEVLDPETDGGLPDYYEKIYSDVENLINQDTEKKAGKVTVTGKIKKNCKCVDRSESSLSVIRIKNILNRYYKKNPDPSFKELPENSVCDTETKNAIIKFQANTNIEQDGCVGDETEAKMVELGYLSKIAATTKPTFTTSTAIDAVDDIELVSLPEDDPTTPSLSFVEEAKKEMKLFSNGKLKEWHPKAWPYIAKYWNHIGSKWLANKTLQGYYLKNKPDRVYHWSAAFIQYCMRGNSQFQELRWSSSGPGNHRYYWKAAEQNTRKLKKGKLPKGKWFYLRMNEAAAIGYEPQVGDILFIGNRRPKHHGDIVVATSGGPSTCGGYQKIGGNNSHSVMLQHRKNTAILTQNPLAYDNFVKFHNLTIDTKKVSSSTSEPMIDVDLIKKRDFNKFSFYLGSIDGTKIDSHNEDKEFYGASIQKPVAALVQMIQYKEDSNKKLNDEELKMLLSYSKTFRGSNQVNRAISKSYSGRSRSYKKRNLGKISPDIMKQVLSIFGISNNTKFVYSNNRQSALDYYKFLSGLQRMSTGKFKNKEEENFAKLYKEEIEKILIYTNYVPRYISDSLKNMGINKFWAKGGRALGSLNYGIIIDNKYVLVVYTRFSNEKFGKPGYEKTGRYGIHTKKMISIINHLVNKIK